MSTSRFIKSAVAHPAWAVQEGAARLRKQFAPSAGRRTGSIGPIKFEFDFDLSPFMRAMYAGAYETEIVSLLRKLLKPGGVFVDVGANIGYISAVASARVAKAGTVLSFEPAPRYFAMLDSLRAANPGYNWKAFNIGIGAEQTTAELAISTKNIGWNSLVPEQIPDDLVQSHVTITVDTLDNCLPAAGIKHIDLLKVDVEGYEANVLAGAHQLLADCAIDNLIVEVLPRQYGALGYDFKTVMSNMVSSGYMARETRRPCRPVVWDAVQDGDNIWFARGA